MCFQTRKHQIEINSLMRQYNDRIYKHEQIVKRLLDEITVLKQKNNRLIRESIALSDRYQPNKISPTESEKSF